jgi:hypothetical protein
VRVFISNRIIQILLADGQASFQISGDAVLHFLFWEVGKVGSHVFQTGK